MIRNSEKDGRILFTLQTTHTTYQMMAGPYGFLLHLYYGVRTEEDMSYLIRKADRGFSGNPYDAGKDKTFSLDVLPQEYPCFGNGDYRSTAFHLRGADGVCGCDLRYHSHRVREGKYALPGLPAVYAGEEQAQTLEVVLKDARSQVTVTLYYGVLPELDVITRAALVTNEGDQPVYVEKAASLALDLHDGEWDMLTFHGRHGMERLAQRTPVACGSSSVGSRRGASSHQENPFVMLARRETNEDWGECLGATFLYSGNFLCEAEQDACAQTRLLLGIHPEQFSCRLEPGEHFQAPEAALSYCAEGLNGLSYRFHRLLRYHVCRGAYQTTRRPVLLNNWEATYFDFDGKKILELARQAAEMGVELFVLDDGWYGRRRSEEGGLGDWQVNRQKLGMSLGELSGQIHALGMKFGLWIEPEMVNEDSDLYRRHPDWALAVPGRKPVRGRHQLVLDFSRKDVVDYILAQIFAVCDEAGVDYIKMDMNRSLCDAFTGSGQNQNSGMIYYRYMLGVYDFLERLRARYPEMLLEGCAGGGGRFDAGMLYYTPQIWCSDNTDAIERTLIQYGTSFGYPVSAVGSHVSAVPNHQTGRTVSLATRAVVAMAGNFGYELDPGKMTPEERRAVRAQIALYQKNWDLIQNGRYYRLTDPETQREYIAWEFVSEDRSSFLLCVVLLSGHFNGPVHYVRLKGLEDSGRYVLEEQVRGTQMEPELQSGWNEHGLCRHGEFEESGNDRFSLQGAALSRGGLPLPLDLREYEAWMVRGTRVTPE